MTPARPIRVAIMNDSHIVVAGLAAMLSKYPDRVDVVELDVQRPVLNQVDIILYDTFAATSSDTDGIPDLLRNTGARLVVYSWTLRPALMREVLEHNAAGYLSKTMSPEQVVQGLEAVHAGRPVPETDADDSAEGDWPGRQHGLSARESEVVALIVQGLSNQEIADNLFLSVNSIKTYIRTAYRKIGVARRAQAVSWGIAHGFVSSETRAIRDSRTPRRH
ncbi:MAG: response regulator transcription factor [Nocardioides sp.]|nr:response regulator transcription factor [Nocardioides sp.]